MKTLLKMIFVVSIVLLAGCGGGSGNTGGLTYEGKTTQAKLTEANSKIFLYIIQNSLNGVAADSSKTGSSLSKLSTQFTKRFSKIAPTKMGKVLDRQTSNGRVSGTVNVTVEEINIYTSRITYEYSNYSNELGFAVDGTVVQDITVDADGVPRKTSTDYQMYTLKIGSESGTIDGISSIEKTDIGSKGVENYILKNNKTNEMFKYENFVMNFDEMGCVLSYAGKVYDSKYGYVNIKTQKDFVYDDDAQEIKGKVLLEGETSVATLIYRYDGTIRVETDTDKDDTVDNIKVYRMNEKRELEVVPNSAPTVWITFPKEIFTDTNMPEAVTIETDDPDFDTVTLDYKWEVNGVVQSNALDLPTSKFAKHDIIKLTVTASDNRGEETLTATKSMEQEVLNSRPIIDASFVNLQLTVGDTAHLEYTVTDADGDDVTINWKHYLDGQIDEYYAFDCQLAIYDYDLDNPDNTYETLTPYEQEDFNNTHCPKRIEGTVVTYPFINDHLFEAVASGAYLHEMTVSDGEYSRTASLESGINKMDIVEREMYNHDPSFYAYDEYSIFMKDFDGDGHKDLIYMISITRHDDGNSTDYQVPTLIIEYRNGDTILRKESYEVNATELDDFYVNDVNGDGRLDIVFTHTNGLGREINNRFSFMLQNDQHTLDAETQKTFANYNALAISDVTGDGSDDIILNEYDNFNDLGIRIFSEEGNTTLETSFPPYGGKHIFVRDMDTNGKQDIVVTRNNSGDTRLEINLNIFFQGNNGNYTCKEYNATLNNDAQSEEWVTNVVVSDFNGEDNLFFVSSTKHIYILKIENDALAVVKKLDYYYHEDRFWGKILEPVDIDRDGKKDLVVLDDSYDLYAGILIQKDNMNFYVEQDYSFVEDSHFFRPGYTLGDINDDGKYEIFFNTGEENLSAIYFK